MACKLHFEFDNTIMYCVLLGFDQHNMQTCRVEELSDEFLVVSPVVRVHC